MSDDAGGKPRASERGRQLRAMFREAIAVLAAILVAFALDAWWDARVERTEALALLRSVDDRMADHIAQIDSVVDANTAVVRAVSALAVAEPEEFDTLSVALMFERYGRFGDFQTLTPELGAVQALTGSTVFGGIRSESLRTSLASVPALWAEAMEEGDVVEENGWAALVQVVRGMQPETATRIFFTGVPPAEADLREMLRGFAGSRDNKALWIAIAVFTNQYMDELRRLQTRLIEIRGLIADELR